MQKSLLVKEEEQRNLSEEVSELNESAKEREKYLEQCQNKIFQLNNEIEKTKHQLRIFTNKEIANKQVQVSPNPSVSQYRMRETSSQPTFDSGKLEILAKARRGFQETMQNMERELKEVRRELSEDFKTDQRPIGFVELQELRNQKEQLELISSERKKQLLKQRVISEQLVQDKETLLHSFKLK